MGEIYMSLDEELAKALKLKDFERVISLGEEKIKLDIETLFNDLMLVGKSYYQIGKDYQKQEEINNSNKFYQKAEEKFRQAFEIRSDEYEVHRWLLSSLARQGRYDEAIAECRKAIELDSKKIHSFIVYADIVMMQIDPTGRETITETEKTSIAEELRLMYNAFEDKADEINNYSTLRDYIVERFDTLKQEKKNLQDQRTEGVARMSGK